MIPEPDEPTRRAVALALAGLRVVLDPPHDVYASRWRLASLAESVESGGLADESRGSKSYRRSPRSIRGVTRA